MLFLHRETVHPKSPPQRIRLCPLKRTQLGNRPRTRTAKSRQDGINMRLHKTEQRESKRRRTTAAILLAPCPRCSQHAHHASCPTYPMAGVMIVPTIGRQQTAYMTNNIHPGPRFRTTSHRFTHRNPRRIGHDKKALCLMCVSPLAPILQSRIEQLFNRRRVTCRGTSDGIVSELYITQNRKKS